MPPFLVAGDDIAYLLPDGTELFSNLSFSINRTQRIALVGRNGCGKSSLAQLMSTDQTPARGTLVRRQ